MADTNRVAHPDTLRQSVLRFKRHMIELALLRSGGNRTYAARSLSITRSHLYALIRRLGVRS